MSSYLFTSESVSEGHPDKVADQISDTVLDAFIGIDPYAHVACETLVTTGQVVIAGEIKVNSKGKHIDAAELARETIKEIGYNDSEMGFDYRSCGVLLALHEQSADIHQGVKQEKEIGAGDQGMMFGHAVNETPQLMPAAITYAHQLVKRLADLRKQGKVKFIRPDAKSQVTVRYENGRPKAVTHVVVSTQHTPDVKNSVLREFVIEDVIKKIIPKRLIDKNIKYFINPTGRFVIGGPHGDTGLTGRKIIVDTYGGSIPHGGGAFSGKDPTKVDRSAAYMGRYVAKNLVAAGAAHKVCVQLAYAIGVVDPVSVMVDSYGTGVVSDQELARIVQKVFPLTPRGIIEKLGLRKPIYRKTAAYGHFGREDEGFGWEKTDLAKAVKACL